MQVKIEGELVNLYSDILDMYKYHSIGHCLGGEDGTIARRQFDQFATTVSKMLIAAKTQAVRERLEELEMQLRTCG